MENKKIVLIVGASSGFGHLVAEKLLKKGLIVYVAARRVERMTDLEKQGAKVIKMDVTDNESVTLGVKRIISEQKRIDAVINNAGYGSYGAIENVSIEEVQHQFDVNVFGMARVNNAVLPHMRKQRSGRIIMTASVVSHVSMAGLGWYAATKHAVKAMAVALRMEVLKLGIDIIQIEPGTVKTEFDSVSIPSINGKNHSEDYQPIIEGFQKLVEGNYRRCPGPKSTANAMVKAVMAKRPKNTYRPTFDAKLNPFVANLLSSKMYTRMMVGVMLYKGKK